MRLAPSAERYFLAIRQAAVELRALGYPAEEIARVLDVSPRTVSRWILETDWSPTSRARWRQRSSLGE